MSVSSTEHLDKLAFILYDRPAGRNVIGYAIEKIEQLRADNERLRAENERLREALSWYADKHNHFPVEHRRPGDPDPAVVFVEEPPIMSDGGKRARKALWGKP